MGIIIPRHRCKQLDKEHLQEAADEVAVERSGGHGAVRLDLPGGARARKQWWRSLAEELEVECVRGEVKGNRRGSIASGPRIADLQLVQPLGLEDAMRCRWGHAPRVLRRRWVLQSFFQSVSVKHHRQAMPNCEHPAFCEQ